MLLKPSLPPLGVGEAFLPKTSKESRQKNIIHSSNSRVAVCLSGGLETADNFLKDPMWKLVLQSLHHSGYEYFVSSNFELFGHQSYSHGAGTSNEPELSLPGPLLGVYNSNSPLWEPTSDETANAQCNRNDANRSLEVTSDVNTFFGLGCYQIIESAERTLGRKYDVVISVRIDLPANETLEVLQSAATEALAFRASRTLSSAERRHSGHKWHASELVHRGHGALRLSRGISLGLREGALELLLLKPFIVAHRCTLSEKQSLLNIPGDMAPLIWD